MRRRPSGSAAEDEGEDSGANVDAIPVPKAAGVRTESQENHDPNPVLRTNPPPLNPEQAIQELDGRRDTDQRPSARRSRLPNNMNWKSIEERNGQTNKVRPAESSVISVPSKEAIADDKMAESRQIARRSRVQSPWSCSLLTFAITIISILSLTAIIHSFTTRQLDSKGCRMSFMRPSFAKLSDFDTEHTRFASKYSVFLYREGQVDEDTKVWANLGLCSNIY